MFIILQAAFLCYALAFAHFQVPVIKAMRDYVPVNNPYNEAFHNRGVIVSGIVALVLSSQIANLLEIGLLIVSFVGIYKIVFDGYIGLKVYGDFFYLGDSSKQDRWLKNVFQFTGAGEAKVIICALVIGVCNWVGL